jgi:hypothetical protein
MFDRGLRWYVASPRFGAYRRPMIDQQFDQFQVATLNRSTDQKASADLVETAEARPCIK